MPADALRGAWFALAPPQVGLQLDATGVAAVGMRCEAVFEAHRRPLPGVPAALEDPRQRLPDLPLAPVTHGPGGRRRPRATALGLDRSLEVFVISEEVGCAKPDPRIFPHCLERVGVAPVRAILVGDDPRTDVAGARSAGVGAVWLNRRARPWPTDAGPRPPTLPSLQDVSRNLQTI